MPRTSVDTLLEVVPEPSALTGWSDGGDGAGRIRRARWWAVAAGLVAVAVTAVALPVRSTVAVNELQALARRWSWSQSLDGQRGQLDAQLVDEAQDGANPDVRRGGLALAAEEVALLLHARSHLLSGWHLPDGGLTRLRRAVAQVLADQAGDLAALAGPDGTANAQPAQPSTAAATDLVARLLTSQLARWHQQPVRPVVAAPLRAATPELARLALPSDQPIDARLALIGRKALTSVDLGAGRSRSSLDVNQGSTVLTGPVVARAGYLAVGATGPFPNQANVYALRPDLGATPSVIGSTFLDVVVAAADPAGVWLQAGSVATEVSGTGAALHAPVPLGLGRILIGATDRLLVTSGLVTAEPSAELQVVPIDGPDAGRASELTTRGQLVAAASGHLAWLDTIAGGTVVLRLADGGARGARVVPPPTGIPPGPVAAALPVDTGAFSPDGSHLVERYLTPTGGAGDLRLGLVDVATGAARLIDGSVGDHPAGTMVWSPAGDRVFFAEAVALSSSPRIATWALDAPRPAVVRVSAPDLLGLTVASGGTEG